MKKYFSLLFIFGILLFNSCKKEKTESGGTAQTQANATVAEVTNLSPQEFSDKIKQTPDAEVIDVRTPEEFKGGHIANAKNFDISGDFGNDIAQLDKTKPVFVYCLSGGRSAHAADVLKSSGFTKVYELQGGLLSWKSGNMPLATDNAVAENLSPKGLTKQQFDAEVNSDKIVLVDFSAVWCGPCQKMKPYIEKISANMKDKVKVLSIDADENPELCKIMKIEALPTIQIYKNNKLTWQNLGFVPEDILLDKLK